MLPVRTHHLLLATCRNCLSELSQLDVFICRHYKARPAKGRQPGQSTYSTSVSTLPHSSTSGLRDVRNFSKSLPDLQARALNDPENKGQMQKGVNFDTLGVWSFRLDLPIDFEQSVQHGKPIPRIPVEEIGVASLVGRRKTNEDRFVVKELNKDLLYVGIFDGHAGSLAAEYASENLENNVQYWLKKTSDLEEVLNQSFIDLNNILGRHLAFYHLNSEESNTGTTATVLLLRNSTDLVVAHVGDSRAILRRGDRAMRLSSDDHPDAEKEAERIIKSKGHIACNSLGEPLVNGRLAMTRSIGDMMLKPYGVIAKPHIHSLKVKHGKDAFVVLVTDGILFSLSDQEIINIISSHQCPQKATEFLSDQALQFGSQDNASVIVIPFGAWGKYLQTEATIQHSFGRTLLGGSVHRS